MMNTTENIYEGIGTIYKINISGNISNTPLMVKKMVNNVLEFTVSLFLNGSNRLH